MAIPRSQLIIISSVLLQLLFLLHSYSTTATTASDSRPLSIRPIQRLQSTITIGNNNQTKAKVASKAQDEVEDEVDVEEAVVRLYNTGISSVNPSTIPRSGGLITVTFDYDITTFTDDLVYFKWCSLRGDNANRYVAPRSDIVVNGKTVADFNFQESYLLTPSPDDDFVAESTTVTCKVGIYIYTYNGATYNEYVTSGGTVEIQNGPDITSISMGSYGASLPFYPVGGSSNLNLELNGIRMPRCEDIRYVEMRTVGTYIQVFNIGTPASHPGSFICTDTKLTIVNAANFIVHGSSTPACSRPTVYLGYGDLYSSYSPATNAIKVYDNVAGATC